MPGTRHPQLHRQGKLWEAFTSETPVVLLIDEIDKADIEFPNDLLQELDRMEFFVYTRPRETVSAKHRPVVIITSNNEGTDAFLRRCFSTISISLKGNDGTHRSFTYPDIRSNLLREAMAVFYEIRDVPGLKKTRRPLNCSTG